MPKRASILHVKHHLEHVERTCIDMLNRNGRDRQGLVLPPIDVDNLRTIAFITRQILRKHAAKRTRKDIYVPRRG
jgi:hypothetical protein